MAAWRAVAVVLILVFSIILIQSLVAGPLVEYTEKVNATGDYSNSHFDGNTIITGYADAWFNMGLIAIFGLMAWGSWRVIRQELTRGRL